MVNEMKSLALIGAVAAMLGACAHKPEAQLTLSGLDPANFETTVDGKPVRLYTLTDARGLEACITNFGGRIVSLMVPDREGRMVDVVLGHDSIADYVNIDGNFGALIGRYGNRIDQGRFTLGDSTYQLPQNNYGHCLHGGPKGFHNSVWNADQTSDSTLTLTLQSPDGEAGFPGTMDVKVTYTLSGNSLSMDYTATADKETLCNLTNHAYFNLSGDPSKPIVDEEVTIDADGFTPIDSTFMTTGEILPVEGTPMDFRKPKTVAHDLAEAYEQLYNGKGYDHNYVLNRPGDDSAPAATVYDPSTGIVLEVLTVEPGLQFYSGNFLDGTVKGKHGIAYPQRSALCLESQHYPDSPNKPQWPSTTLRPGETYHTTTSYRFATR